MPLKRAQHASRDCRFMIEFYIAATFRHLLIGDIDRTLLMLLSEAG